MFLDIQGGFENVWVPGLIYKLADQFQLRGRTLLFCKALLSGRRFRVVHQSLATSWRDALAGVPQGGVLSPLFYIAFINDIRQILVRTQSHSLPPKQLIRMHMYADDIAVNPFLAGLRGLGPLQKALSCLAEYAATWKFSWSHSKTVAVIFNNLQSMVSVPALRLGNFTIKVVQSFKYLGLVLQQNGKWD